MGLEFCCKNIKVESAGRGVAMLLAAEIESRPPHHREALPGETLRPKNTITATRPTCSVEATVDHPTITPPKRHDLRIERPNFVIIMPDQLRYKSLGFAKNRVNFYSQVLAV